MSLHPAKADNHTYCGSKDIILLVVDEQDSTCLNLQSLLVSKVNNMSRLHAQNFTIKKTIKKIFASVSNE